MTVNENPKEYMKMEEEPVHSPAAAGARLGAQRLGAW